MTRRILFAVLTMLGCLTVLAVAGEMGARQCFDRSASVNFNEKGMAFRYDPVLGWFPPGSQETTYGGSRLIHIKSNRRGFRDVEHGPRSRRRLAFVGDSFVWGFDVEAEERFTDRLQARLPDWEIFNYGVSGYGTDQESILLSQILPVDRPDVVVLIFCADNDRSDNQTNVQGGYYKPYFTVNGTRLELQGVPAYRSIAFDCAPYREWFRSRLLTALALAVDAWKRPMPRHVPDPTHLLVRSMQGQVAAQGARFLVASTGPDPALQAWCATTRIPYLELHTDHRFKEFGRHWSPLGHREVADQIQDWLTKKTAVKGDR